MIAVSNLEKLIASNLAKLDAKPLAVVLDSLYFSLNQKAVYMEYSGKTGKVDAFYREQGENNTWEKVYVTTEVLSSLANRLSTNCYGGVTLGVSYDLSMIELHVDVQLGLVMFESALYRIGRRLMQNERNDKGLNIGQYSFSSEELRSLKNTFRRESYSNYLKFIYSRIQARIIPKCYKRKAFYNIQKAFVPVFIHYDYVYDPLLDDIESHVVRNSTLYKMAVEKNRLVVVSEHLSCYMLTHEEICKSFGLDRFMRFTPEFVYKVFVGLIRPDLQEFPSKQQFKYVLISGYEQPDGFKRIYTRLEYEQLRDILAEKVLNAEKSGDTALLEETNREFNKLNSYMEINTLRYHCNSDKRTLTSIGSSTLDGKVSANDLYNIIFEATLGGD